MKISKGTLCRSIALLLVVMNIILEGFGIDLVPTTASSIFSAAETAAEVISIGIAWWYNNSFTEKARAADALLKELCRRAKGEADGN